MAEGGVDCTQSAQTCGICLKVFERPKLLPCFHSFCFSCIKQHIEITVRNGRFNCPNCRRPTEVPSNGAEGFQSNFYISTEKKASKEFCKEHPTEEIRMVCKSCDKLLCIVCKMTAHDNHTSEELSTRAEQARKEVQKIIEGEEIHTLLRKLDESESKLKEFSLQLDLDLQTKLKMIDKQVQTVVEEATSRAKELKEGLQQEYIQTQTINECKQQICKTESQSVNSLISKAFESSSNDFQIIRNGPDICKKLKEKLKFDLTSVEVKDITKTFKPQDKDKLKPTLGNIVQKPSPPQAKAGPKSKNTSFYGKK